MNSTDDGWCIWASPCWLWEVIGFLRIIAEQVLDWTWQFPHTLRGAVEKIHLIVFVSDLIRHATCPSLYLNETGLLFVVSGLAYVDFFAAWEAPGTAPAETGDKHDEASIQHVLNLVIPILSSFDNLMVEEVFVEAVHGLFGAVVPAGVDPPLSVAVLPGPENLGDDGFCEIVGIANVNPVTCLRQVQQ